MSRVNNSQELHKIKNKGLSLIYPRKTRISVGTATCGISAGAQKVYDIIEQEVHNLGLDAVVTNTGCIGYCVKEPLVDITQHNGPRVIYQKVTEQSAREIVKALAGGTLPSENALCRISSDIALISGHEQRFPKGNNELSKIPLIDDLPFFKKQIRISLRNSGFIDPDAILEYIGRGGFEALHKVVLHMSPEQVIEQITLSGLRGRGGAGFPTGTKWQMCRMAQGDKKYIICNADEGDPGAFMDRNILEGDPYSVIEGMIIGAYAIGAGTGYIYCRAEYPLAIQRLKHAIGEARAFGFLGEEIFGSDFDFNLIVRAGAGAFVCGEETALIASIEGDVGEPRTKPPYPAEKGLWGKPTTINNVKTWSQVAPIIAKGATWYSQLGTEQSMGTTVFSLVGKVRNTGLVEIPLGLSLREMIEEIGEGIADGRPLKAIQTGGPSGGCIPVDHLDVAITYETLGRIGSIMGSGGMIVMDDSTCMVDLAKYFISFTQEESCGKCTPCREGTKRMFEILDKICKGNGTAQDLTTLAELSEYIKDTSFCGLGATAPNPVITTLKYFRDEYDAHVRDKRCPALTCQSLIRFDIVKEKCVGCLLCLKACPAQAITGERKRAHMIDQQKCTRCGTCLTVCPKKVSAVVKSSPGIKGL